MMIDVRLKRLIEEQCVVAAKIDRGCSRLMPSFRLPLRTKLELHFYGRWKKSDEPPCFSRWDSTAEEVSKAVYYEVTGARSQLSVLNSIIISFRVLFLHTVCMYLYDMRVHTLLYVDVLCIQCIRDIFADKLTFYLLTYLLTSYLCLVAVWHGARVGFDQRSCSASSPVSTGMYVVCCMEMYRVPHKKQPPKKTYVSREWRNSNLQILLPKDIT